MKLQNDFKVLDNNTVSITGSISSEFRFSHEIFGETFYIVDISVKRNSGVFDVVPVMVSERLIDVTNNNIGQKIKVFGQFRSYNHHVDDRNRLILNVFAKEIEFIDSDDNCDDSNKLFLDGFVCKPPVYRQTTLGREIADLLIAVNRPYGKSDYIPCICWGRNARYVGGLKVGERIEVHGRIQSRVYTKRLPDGSSEERTAYEVSVGTLEVVEK